MSQTAITDPAAVALRNRIALEVFPTVVAAAIDGKITTPTKADGSPLNIHFRAAIHARNFADALVVALQPRDENNATSATSAKPKGGI